MKQKTIYTIALALLTACGAGEQEYDATGVFEATEVTVSAEESGRILYLGAEEGAVLRLGEEVGLIDTVQLHLQRRMLTANQKSVESQRPDISKQMATINQQIATAIAEKSRTERLLAAGAANRKQLDDWDAQISLLRRQLSAQESTLRNSAGSLTEQSSAVTVQVAQVDDRLHKCHIVSPIDGTVLSKYAEGGELATVGKPLFKVADTKNMYLRAYITSAQLSTVKIGTKVKLFADYGADKQREYTGTITWISATAEFTPKTILTQDERADQVYAVKVAFVNDGEVKIGMYGGLKF